MHRKSICTASSQAAAITVTDVTADNAIDAQVIFQKKKKSTRATLVTPTHAEHSGLAHALKGKLLGGAPDEVKETQLLGAHKKTCIPMSCTALAQIAKTRCNCNSSNMQNENIYEVGSPNKETIHGQGPN